MATAIRMKRIGAKKAPVYRIIVTDSRKKRDGRTIEVLGMYDPRTEPASVNLNDERVQYWLGTGATPSDTVRNIFQKVGFYSPEGPSLERTDKLQRSISVIAGEKSHAEKMHEVAAEMQAADAPDASDAADESGEAE